MSARHQDELHDDNNSQRDYTPAEVIDWIRVWLTQPNRERSKFTDILLVILTLLVAVAGFWSAFIFQGQLTEARNLSKRQFSPYLLYEGGKAELIEGGRSLKVSVQVKNFGQTPAYSATHWLTAQVMDRLSDPFSYFDYRRPSNIVFRDTAIQGVTDVGPGQSVCIRRIFPLSQGAVGKVIYVWGDVKYADQSRKCQLEAFVLQGAGPIPGGASSSLADIMPWASDAMNPASCSETGKAKPPWPEKPGRPEDEAGTTVFQGTCPE